MEAYMKGGKYNLTAFQQHLCAVGLSVSTAIVYTSVVRKALRELEDTTPERIHAYAMTATDRSFPAAWNAFVKYARGRGRTIGDYVPAVSTSANEITVWDGFPEHNAYASILQVAVQCYWDLSEMIPLRCIDESGSAMQRYGRTTWRDFTGTLMGEDLTGERDALRRILRWGWGITSARVITSDMEGLTLFPRTPKCNEQLTISEMAGVALAARNRKLAEKIVKGRGLHLPQIQIEPPQPPPPLV